jgi:hypothetical protein
LSSFLFSCWTVRHWSPACPPARLHATAWPDRPPTPVHDDASKSIPFLATSPGKDRVVLVYSDKIEVRTKVILQILIIVCHY